MKKNYSSVQKRIYSDYECYSTEKLLEMVKSNEFADEVVAIFHDIIAERNILSNEITQIPKSYEKDIDEFILRTYKIWKSGKLTILIPNSKESADSMSYSEFKELINSSIEYAISTINEKTSLQDGEFFISNDGNKGKVFILTNQRLFISPINDTRKEIDIINIKDINTIEFKTGWTVSGTIKLHNGQVFNYTKLDSYIKEEFINKLKSIDNSYFINDINDDIAFTQDNNIINDGKVTETETKKTSNSGNISFILTAIAAGCFFVYMNRDKLDSEASIIIYIIGGVFIAYNTRNIW